jgi:hypothetical protein
MKVESVASLFATYRAKVLHPDAPPVQVQECARAFYAGAYFMLMDGLFNIGDQSTSEEEGIAELEKLKDEIEAFSAAGGMPLPTAVPPAPEVPDINYTIPDPHDIRALLTELGEGLGAKMPAGWGFNLLIFQYGAGGGLFYISSARREDVIATMKEFIQRQTQ